MTLSKSRIYYKRAKNVDALPAVSYVYWLADNYDDPYGGTINVTDEIIMSSKIVQTQETNEFWFTTTKQAQSWEFSLTTGETYRFDWGDGTIDSYTGNGALQTVTHTYAAPGVYQIKLKIHNPLALLHFRCDENELWGTIPSFAACTNLYAFFCSTNHFSGLLPSFAACVNLEYFHCHFNQFSDYTPGLMPTPCWEFSIAGSNLFPTTAVDAILVDFATNIAARPAIALIYLGGTGNAAPSSVGIAHRNLIWSAKGEENWFINHN